MADGDAAGKAFNHLAAGEGVADKAEAAFGVEAVTVEGHNAGSFLAAMLKGVKAERGDGGSIGMTEDAEHTAFFAERVAVEIEIRIDVDSGVGASLEGLCWQSIAPRFSTESGGLTNVRIRFQRAPLRS